MKFTMMNVRMMEVVVVIESSSSQSEDKGREVLREEKSS